MNEISSREQADRKKDKRRWKRRSERGRQVDKRVCACCVGGLMGSFRYQDTTWLHLQLTICFLKLPKARKLVFYTNFRRLTRHTYTKIKCPKLKSFSSMQQVEWYFRHKITQTCRQDVIGVSVSGVECNKWEKIKWRECKQKLKSCQESIAWTHAFNRFRWRILTLTHTVVNRDLQSSLVWAFDD